MIVTVPKKNQRVVLIPVNQSTTIVSATANSLSLGQLKSVDISNAEANDVLMFDGTKWQAESLDGGTFN